MLPFCQMAAFWVAVLGYRGDRVARLILGLGLGAILARVGWGLLHSPQIFFAGSGLPRRLGPVLGYWLGVEAGLSLLFVPVGVLLSIPWWADREARLRYAAATSRSLAPAFGVARLGCVFAGCCSGLPFAGAPEGGSVHPTALYELLGWGGVSAGLARVASRWVPGLFLAAFGGLRLATEPWRAPPPLGEPVLDPGWIAAAWLVVGLSALALTWIGSPRVATIGKNAAAWDRACQHSSTRRSKNKGPARDTSRAQTQAPKRGSPRGKKQRENQDRHEIAR
jgi:prolipoprotein diacylglyceryltransferase